MDDEVEVDEGATESTEPVDNALQTIDDDTGLAILDPAFAIIETLALAALATILDLTSEITRVLSDTAARITSGIAVAPIMDALLDTIAPIDASVLDARPPTDTDAAKTTLTQSALTTILDLTSEITVVLQDTATQVTSSIALSPMVDALLATIAPADVPALDEPPVSDTDAGPTLTQAALTTILDFTSEIAGVLRETATQVTSGIAVAPIVDALLETVAPAATPALDEPPVADTDAEPTLAQAALTTIHDLTSEITRALSDTATRVTDGIAAPIVDALLETIVPFVATSEPSASDPDAAWRARLMDAEAALAYEVQRAAALEEHCELAIVGLSDARGQEQALRTELATVLERGCAEQAAISRRAEQLVASAEEQRSAAARESEAARAALGAAQQASLQLRDELSLVRNDAARTAALAEEARQGREQIEVEVQGLRTRLAESHERLRLLEGDAARGHEERKRNDAAEQAELAEREAGWNEQLATLRAEHARERDRAEARTEELERQRIELGRLQRREKRLREEIRAVAVRADADREETVRRAQEMVQTAEQARAAAIAELEGLRAMLAGDRARLLQMEAEHERANQGAAEREAALAEASSIIDEREASRLAVASELERTSTRLAATEQELLAVQHELGLVQRQIDKLSTAHDDLIEDHARRGAVLEEMRTREQELRTHTDESREQVRSLEIERGRLAEVERQFQELQQEHTQSTGHTIESDAEIERQREQIRTIDDALAHATAALEQATSRERRLQEELAAGMQHAAEQEDTLREARTFAAVAEKERAAAVAEGEALRTAMASSQRLILEAEEETRVARAEAERLAVAHEAAFAEQRRLEAAAAAHTPSVESPAPKVSGQAPEETAPAPTTSAPNKPLDAHAIVILDAHGEWPAVSGTEVRALVPDERTVAKVLALAPGRCLVNLASAGALEAAAAIRERGLTIPLWGFISAPEADRGQWLGPFDIFSRPIDPELVRTQLLGMVPKNGRILAVGSDGDTFMPLRHGLMKAGMAVSIAWDLKQAIELAEIVTPHVVVLDLGLPARATASFVIGLAKIQPSPSFVVIPGATGTIAGFSAALCTLIPSDGGRSRANLLNSAMDAKTKTAAAS